MSQVKTIYLVHDQEEDPAGRQNFLEMAGFRVVLMQSGRELIMALREKTPELVVMDVLINGRNGFEVCREVTASHHERFPVILCSRVYQGHVFSEEARKVGAIDYVPLPMNLDDFVIRVSSSLSAWRQRAAAVES